MSLSDSELWERVSRLEGETVYTIKRRNPNKISRVTADRVEIAERKTKPSREDILRVLQRMGRVTREDLYGNASILKNPLARKTGRIIMAILAAAVPEEIDVIPETERLSGIRLRGQ